MKKHSVTINGETFTRNSKTRSYAHAVALRSPDGEWSVESWTGQGQKAADRSRRAWLKARASWAKALEGSTLSERERVKAEQNVAEFLSYAETVRLVDVGAVVELPTR